MTRYLTSPHLTAHDFVPTLINAAHTVTVPGTPEEP